MHTFEAAVSYEVLGVILEEGNNAPWSERRNLEGYRNLEEYCNRARGVASDDIVTTDFNRWKKIVLKLRAVGSIHVFGRGNFDTLHDQVTITASSEG